MQRPSFPPLFISIDTFCCCKHVKPIRTHIIARVEKDENKCGVFHRFTKILIKRIRRMWNEFLLHNEFTNYFLPAQLKIDTKAEPPFRFLRRRRTDNYWLLFSLKLYTWSIYCRYWWFFLLNERKNIRKFRSKNLLVMMVWRINIAERILIVCRLLAISTLCFSYPAVSLSSTWQLLWHWQMPRH